MKKVNVVKKYSEYQTILNNRKFKRNELYTVYYLKKSQENARIGLLVGKKNGNAVTRVKIKRQIRCIIDENVDYKNGTYDFIVVVGKNYKTDQFTKNKSLLIELFTSIKEK